MDPLPPRGYTLFRTSPSPPTPTPLPHHFHCTPKRGRLRSRAKAQEVGVQEIRVCTNRTCRKQGSFQTLETLSALAPPNVAVNPCGCLGRCGVGPNLAVLPDGLIVCHCGTAARASEVMVSLFGGGAYDAKPSLDALALRKRAEVELEKRNFTEAELLLSQAIDLKPFGGIHVLFKCRSFVRLELGNYSGALEDASQALTLAPRYSEAYICQGDAFLALNQFDSAEQSYLTLSDIDPSIRRSKSFKARITKLQEKLAAANTLILPARNAPPSPIAEINEVCPFIAVSNNVDFYHYCGQINGAREGKVGQDYTETSVP